MRKRRPLVSLTFDDGTRDHLDVARLLADRDLAATFYVSSGLIGSSPEQLTWDAVSEIAELGHEIGGHTSHHPDLVTLDEEAALAQVADDRRQLIAHGIDPVTFAYPYGSQNVTVRALVARAGYTCGRRAWGLAADADDLERPLVESVPPPDRYALRTYPSIENGTTLDDLKHVVERARQRRGWIPLVLHKITEGPWSYELSATIFEPFVDWLAAERNNVPVATIASALRR
jgi:peptidoglycan/xylan/chitin deacetylase (PgdA/CDA1 family)